jgi:hypothetical protein
MGNIQATRSRLIRNIDSSVPDLTPVVSALLHERVGRSKTPLLGEVMPWLFTDVTGTDREVAEQISAGWLALYLYSTFIDDQLDRPEQKLRPKELLAATALFHSGISILKRFTAGTYLDDVLDGAVFSSIRFELSDVAAQSSAGQIAEKARASAEKNSGLIACAAAFVATAPGRLHFLLEFTRELLLGCQYLDDLCDRDDDWVAGNMTVLLTGISAVSGHGERRSSIDLLDDLVRSGSLLSVAEAIEQAFTKALACLRPHSTAASLPQANLFLVQLLDQIGELKLEIRRVAEMPIGFADHLRKDGLKSIDERIALIAQSS